VRTNRDRIDVDILLGRLVSVWLAAKAMLFGEYLYTDIISRNAASTSFSGVAYTGSTGALGVLEPAGGIFFRFRQA
jgi:hypothetical protein